MSPPLGTHKHTSPSLHYVSDLMALFSFFLHTSCFCRTPWHQNMQMTYSIALMSDSVSEETVLRYAILRDSSVRYQQKHHLTSCFQRVSITPTLKRLHNAAIKSQMLNHLNHILLSHPTLCWIHECMYECMLHSSTIFSVSNREDGLYVCVSVSASARMCVFVELVDVWGLVCFFKERRHGWNLPAE